MKLTTTAKARREFLDELIRSHAVPEVFEAWKTGQIRMESALLCCVVQEEIGTKLLFEELLDLLEKKL